MKSPIDQRIAARLHQQQIAFVGRTDRIAAQVAAVYARLLRRLLEIAAGGDLAQVPSLAASAVHQAQIDAYHVLEAEYPKLVRQANRDTVGVLLKTVPHRWWRRIAHPHIHGQASRRGRHGRQVEAEDDALYAGVVDVIDELEPVRLRTMTPEESVDFVQETVFPPLDPPRINRILTSPGAGGMTWQERFHRYSGDDQGRIAHELTAGIADGEPLPALRKRLETVVEGPSYKAQRIARTEGRRVAEVAQREAFAAAGDLLSGMQILAVMDEATRPEHAARNGKVYKRQPDGTFQDEAGKPLPDLPDAPNCRCTAVPVLKMPSEFEADPLVKADFENAAGQEIPDPSAYTDWFANASEEERVAAVGRRRYQVVSQRLSDAVEPEWTDFIDTDGSLVPISQLKKERQEKRDRRKLSVADMIFKRKQFFEQVSAFGYLDKEE